MAGKPDMGNVGSDKPVKNPQDAVDAENGTYNDAAQNLPDGAKYMPLDFPRVDVPRPFKG